MPQFDQASANFNRHSDRIFFQLSWDLLAVFSAEGRMQQVNPAWTRILGWQEQELLGTAWLDRVHPDDRTHTCHALIQGSSQAIAVFQNRLHHQTGHYIEFEWKVQHAPDGHLFAIAHPIAAMQLPEGMNTQAEINFCEQELRTKAEALQAAMAALQQERHSREQLETALAESDSRLKNLAANLPGAIFQFSCDHNTWKMDYISEGIWGIMGVKATDVMKNLGTFTARIHPKDIRRYLASVAEAIANLSPWHFEGRLIKPSGQVRWWQGDATPTQTIDGAIAFCGVLLDVTERKQAELALKQTKQELEATVAERTQELQRMIDQLEQDRLERQQTEARLREREQFLSNIYEGVNHEIFVIDVGADQEFRHAGLNPFAEKVTGFRTEEVTGKTMHQIFGTDGDAIARQFQQCVDLNNTLVYEECLSFHNQPTWWLTTLNPLYDSNGQIYRLVGTAFDISDRIQIEQALRESQQLLQIVFNTLPQRVFWKDRNLVYLGCNKQFAQDAGFQSPEELIGKDDFAMVWRERAALYRQEDTTLMDENRAKINVEEYRTGADGRIEWIRNSMIPLHNAAGDVIGIFGCYEDISEQKQAELERQRAEAQLRQSEQRFRDVSEAVGEYLWDIDPNGIYTFVTDKSRVVKGYSPTELLGQSFFDFMPPDDVVIVRQTLQTAIAHKHSFNLQHRTLTPTGAIVWEEVNGIPIFNDLGEVIGFRGTGLSITERKQAEAALRQSEAELRQQTQELEQTLHELQYTQAQLIQSEKMSSLGQLVAGVAHEINNPVNFIHGNLIHANQYTQDLVRLLGLYREQCPTPPSHIQQQEELIDLDFLMDDLPKLLTSMKVGTERIREIVKSLRTFSRLDEAEFKTVDVHDGIESTLLILQNRLKFKSNSAGIQVIKHYGQLPPVECFAGQLNQVLMNILSNAIDALEDQWDQLQMYEEPESWYPKITIATELLLPDQTLATNTKRLIPAIAIHITDNGPGIPSAVQQRLFDPFFTTKQVGKGTGLGMSISYQIITERHRGSLTCLSQWGKGATFTIKIPVRQA
jgi:PAS domain S-box-containing protein